MPVTRYLEADVTGTSIEVSKVLVEGVGTIGTTQGCLVGTTSWLNEVPTDYSSWEGSHTNWCLFHSAFTMLQGLRQLPSQLLCLKVQQTTFPGWQFVVLTAVCFIYWNILSSFSLLTERKQSHSEVENKPLRHASRSQRTPLCCFSFGEGKRLRQTHGLPRYNYKARELS